MFFFSYWKQPAELCNCVLIIMYDYTKSCFFHVYINVCLRYFHMHQYIYNRKNLLVSIPIDIIQVYNLYNTGHGSTCIYCIACKYIFGGNKNYVKERIGTVNLLGRKMNIFPNILFSKSSAIH